MTEERFPLEDLSKISGATSSKQVLEFFHTLDKYISDEEVKTYMETTKRDTAPASILRKDVITQKREEVRKTIIANFPDHKDTAIRVPQIIQ